MSLVAVLSTKGLGFSNLSQVLRKRGAFVPAAAAAADGELELFAGYFLNVIFNIHNKKVYNYFPYPYFVSVIHLLVGLVFCLTCRECDDKISV
ncbi:unnamed protein product [Rhodiola kirilowii]